MIKVNIVIPAYNEEKRIHSTLRAYKEFYSKQSNYDIRMYIINDGSKDNTGSLLQDLLAEYKFPADVIEFKENRGKGAALKYGVLNSREADYYYLADADLSADWNILPQFLEVAESDNYDVVIASRGLATSKVNTKLYKRILGRLSAQVIKLLLNLKIQDTQCGYKLFKKQTKAVFEKVTVKRWSFDFELLYLLNKNGFSIKEVGIKWTNKSGSKVKLLDYPKQLIELYKVRTMKRNEK